MSGQDQVVDSKLRTLLVGGLYVAGAMTLGVLVGRDSAPVSTLYEFAVPELSAAPQGSVTLVMQPADCVNNTRSLEWWSEVGAEGLVFVSGIIVTDDVAESQAALRNARLRFPTSTVDHGGIGRHVRALGYHTTPLVILSDPLGRVRAAAPMSEFRTEEDVLAFVRILNRSPASVDLDSLPSPSGP